MAAEKFRCPECGTVYTVEWDEDAMVDYMEPAFCPFCGVELDSYSDEDYQEEYEENNSMWSYNDEEFTSEMIGDHLGFVYEITDTDNGKKYIGKKKFWSKITRPPLKGKTRKRKIIKESDWQKYYGSSEEVKSLVEECGQERFSRRILHLCDSLGELSYMELKEQVEREVLFKPDEYYNAFIGVKIHRNHVLKKK